MGDYFGRFQNNGHSLNREMGMLNLNIAGRKDILESIYLFLRRENLG